MDRLTFADQHCSVARTLDIIGDRWTPLILRDVALGVSRFDAIQRNLGLSRKVLAQRLALLVKHGVVERARYQDNPVRHDYLLTEKGRDLAMVLFAIQSFGDKWMFGTDGPPLEWRHLGCGEITGIVACCENCGDQVQVGDAVPLKGPSFDDSEAPELALAIDRLGAMLG